jgi:transposase
VILFEDECSLSNTATVSYSWCEKGTQPRIECKQRGKERVTLFGAVNYLSGQVTIQPSLKGNGKSFKKFLKKVLDDYKGKKVTMILDNVRYHHALKLNRFLETNKDKLNLVFLPPYSPDFNPMERVWWFMRKKITHNRACSTMEERLIRFWKLFSHFQKPNSVIVNLCNTNYSV